MSEWLVRHFVKGYQDYKRPLVRIRYGQFAGVVGIVCNLVLCIAKGIIGFIAGSISIVADAVNNLSDASSNVISLLGFKLAAKPADLEHPYGHGRYEYLSGLLVAVVIVVFGLELIQSSIDKIINPQPTDFGIAVFCILLLSILVKLWMYVFNMSISKRISSDTLRAAAVDSRNDVITTSLVLVCALISYFAEIDLDGWVGAAVGIFVVWSGICLIKDTVDPLLGRAPDPEKIASIQEKILSYPGVLGTHDLMVHDYGPGRLFASAHVELSAELDQIKSHDLIDSIEQDAKNEAGLILTLHCDPIITNDPALKDLRNWVDSCAKEINPDLSIHDLRTISGTECSRILFDCLCLSSIEISDEELCDRLSKIVEQRYPNAICDITIDHSYLSSKQ